jgi:LAO/AO transport system kinase
MLDTGTRANRPALDRHALGRALTTLANAGVLDMLHRPAPAPTPRTARRIGLTGAPGAGKSTLAGHLALHRASLPIDDSGTDGRRRRIGVLAVDPSSPRTGGAILGDRIRMDELPGSSEIFIRSLGSRSTSDGLSDNLPEMLDLMDLHDFDDVLLETVGVGQVETAARAQVDTLVLVLLPDSGDTVQAMKAGILEMADICVVNKSDLPGAARMASDMQRITAVARHQPGQWQPPVLLASCRLPDSVAALSQAIDAHQHWLGAAGQQQLMHDARARYRLRRLIERQVAHVVAGLGAAVMAGPFERQLAIAGAQLTSMLWAEPSTHLQETRHAG